MVCVVLGPACVVSHGSALPFICRRRGSNLFSLLPFPNAKILSVVDDFHITKAT